jgi:hypothetical protein
MIQQAGEILGVPSLRKNGEVVLKEDEKRVIDIKRVMNKEAKLE